MTRLLTAIVTAAIIAIGVAATPQPTASAATVSPAAEQDRGRAAQTTDSVTGRVIRFQGRNAKVDVTITSDNPASRDLVSMLPLKLRVREFAGKEKIAYLPRKLDIAGAPGTDPENRDLIYYAPWGNLGFYYDASGVGFAADTIPIGSYRASRKKLTRLQRGRVTVRLLPRRSASSVTQ